MFGCQSAGQPYILEFYMGGAYRSGLVILVVPEESFCFPSLRALVAHTHTHTVFPHCKAF